MPLSTVDRSELWALISHFQPCYVTPSRPTLRKKIGPAAERMREAIKKTLLESEYVSFTKDIWTDHTTKESFISLSDHWIN